MVVLAGQLIVSATRVASPSAATSLQRPVAVRPRARLLSVTPGTISTIAGGVGGGSTNPVALGDPTGVAVDSSGNVYATDDINHVVRERSTSGAFSVVAGNGLEGSTGDSGPATIATLSAPQSIAFDGSGNLYIGTVAAGPRIRKVSTTGTITTFAGSGSSDGYSGDGGPATAATMHCVSGPADACDIVFVGDDAFIADTRNHAIREVDASGTITTAAGGLGMGYSGDSGPATSAQLFAPGGITADSSGDLFIADTGNDVVREIDTSGTITTVAGNHTDGYAGDSGPATSAELSGPGHVQFDAAGNLYISDTGNHVVRKVDTSGTITTVVGNGTFGFSGDTGAATSAELSSPQGLAFDSSGNLYIADQANNRIRKVDTSGIISTVIGNGLKTYSGDGGDATHAQLLGASHLATDGLGNMYIADSGNDVIRKVAPNGTITTVAGDGTAGFSGDSGAATAAELDDPEAVAADSAGNLYIADTGNDRIRVVSTAGVITTLVPPSHVTAPTDVALAVNGDLYVVENGTVDVLDTKGIYTTAVIGGGGSSTSGDGGPANAAGIDPTAIAIDGADNIFVADEANANIRKVNAAGIISTYAGTGTPGSSGDGGPASSADMTPTGIAIDTAGNLFFSERTSTHATRLREIDAAGTITTVAGTGTFGYSGDGGAATSAKLEAPGSPSIDNAGNVSFPDGHRIRQVALIAAPGVTGLTAKEAAVSNPSELTYCSRCNGDPVDALSGNFFESYTDLAIPGRSPALNETRTYGSLNATYDGPFGHGWSSSYDMHLNLGAGTPAATVDVVQENNAEVSFAWNGTAYVAPSRVLGTLTFDSGTNTYTYTRRAQEQFVFDATGLLTEQIARNGFAGSPGTGVPAAYTTTLTYASGQLSTVTDAAGRTLTFTYGPNGKVSAIADSTGRSVGYGYDGSDNLTDVTDVELGNTHFTYDTNHFLLTIRDPRGNTVLTNTYDAGGRTLTQKDALLRTTSFDYTSIPGSTKISRPTSNDPSGNVTLDTFSNNVLVSETKGLGSTSQATWTYTYDPVTLGVATVTDPNLHVTKYTWDASGNPLTTTDALLHTTRYTYNSFGEPLTIEDPKLVTTTNTYDAAGNLTATATPLVEQPGQTQTTSYAHGDSAHPGDVTSITDPRLKIWGFSYDASTGDLLSETSPVPGSDETTYTYDGAGRRLTMVSPEGNKTGGTPSLHTTTYTYDAFGDVKSVSDQLTHQTQYDYDPDRNLTQVTDPLLQVTTYDYDIANQLTTIHRPGSPATALHNDYWDDGSLKTQTDDAGSVTSYFYDPIGRLSETTDPQSRPTNYTYDPAGNLRTVADNESRTTTYNYNDNNTLQSVNYSDGRTPNVSYTDNADDQRETMTDGTGTTHYTVDSLHRLTSQQDGSGQTMTYGYDLANNVTSITYPGSPPHTVTRGYDESGRLHTVTDWLTPTNNTTTYTYDHDSNLITQAYPNTTTATYTPDAADRLTNIADTKGATTFASFAYTRNADDALTMVTPVGVGQSTESYGYSALNQLNAVNSSNYTYDNADNLTSTPDGTHLAYDNANQLCRTAPAAVTCSGTPPTGTTNFSYGNDGERTSMTSLSTPANPTVNYAYDEENRLTDVRGAGYRTAVLSSNPLAYWRLGEASGTSAADSSGDAYNGAYHGGGFTYTQTPAVTSDPNTALKFNGTSSYMQPTNPVAAGQSKTFTAEAWVKGSATTGRYFLDEGNTTTTTPYWGLATDGTTGTHALFTFRDSSGLTATVTGTKIVMDGNWHHVVGVRSNNTVSLYVDGAADGTTTVVGTLGALPTLNAITSVGALQRTMTISNYFSGWLDEPALYGTALSPAQIKNHFQAAKSNYAGTVTGATPGLYWRLGETTGTVAADASSNSQTGTYKPAFPGNPSTTALTPSGDADKAINLNGSTQYVDDTQTTGTTTAFSMEVWIKTSQTTGTDGYFIAKGSTTSNTPFEGITLSPTFTKAVFSVRDNSGHQVVLTGTTTVNNSIWHHVVGVRDTTTNLLLLYVDGKLDATTSASALTAAVTTNTTTVGALKRLSSAVTNFAPGSVDEAAYYPAALNATTIASHYYNANNAQPEAATYTYNGDGTRTAKTVDGTTTNFTWDTAEGLPLLASDGATQYIYGLGGTPLEQVTNGVATYYHQDQQGSTRALTDQTGSVIGTYTADAYGNPTVSSGTGQTPLRYDGEYRDNETGFIYLRARFYDPATGQFMTRDPLAAGTREPYAYAAGSPLNGTDPSGLFCGGPLCGVVHTVIQVAKCVTTRVLHCAKEAEDAGHGNLEDPGQSGVPFNPGTNTALGADPAVSGVVGAFVNALLGQITELEGLCAVTNEAAEEATSVAELAEGWRGTNMSDEESFEYHYAKHGAGRTAEQYAQDASGWAAQPAGNGTPVTLADGSTGIRYRTPGGGPGGILDSNGNIVTFWYR